MKRYLCTFTIAVICLAGPAYAADIMEDRVQDIILDLCKQHSEKQQISPVKQGIAVLPFEEKSDEAKKRGLGETVREAMSRMIMRNNLFYLVDRDTVEKSMKELELSMTGMVRDEEVIKAGQLAGVKVFLLGTITGDSDSFTVNARLVDVASGMVAAMAKGEIPQKVLIMKKEQYAYEQIAQYGLGINYQMSFGPHIQSPRPNAFFMVHDIFVNYRPYLWLNFKLGISYYTLEYTAEEVGTAADIYPDLSNPVNFPEAADYRIHAKDCTMNEIAPYIGVDYNWTPLTFFTLGIGLSMGIYQPSFTQVFNNMLIFPNADASTTITNWSEREEVNGMIIEQEMDSLSTFRLEVKPQFFISPRFTIGLYLAYMYTTPMKLSRSTINSEYTTSSQFTPNKVMRNKYMGINPNIQGNGHDITALKLMTALYGFSINFFF